MCVLISTDTNICPEDPPLSMVSWLHVAGYPKSDY